MLRRRFAKALHLTTLTFGITVVIIIAAALAFQYRIHIANEWEQQVKLPAFSAPQKNRVLLVFAPHSDDETLGCGGLLATAVKNHAKVHVALITNGDGYKISIAKAYKTLNVTPARSIEFAYRRQGETLKALSEFGVHASNVTFFGYPDRGIEQLWDKYWTSDTLFTSATTKRDHSPYSDSFTRNAPYCGESLMSDIGKLLKEVKPTDVYIPHPSDNHPDHYATYCFVTAAIDQLQSEGNDFAKKIKAHTYLVHRGDWPVPRGKHIGDSLAPPYALAQGETKWYSLELPQSITKLKLKAIQDYKTQQVSFEKGFLDSFARQNEIFGDVPKRQIKHSWQDRIKVDGNPEDWTGIPPAVVDPVGDYLVAGMNRGGDVHTIYLCYDAQHLFIRLDCVKRLSKQLTYTFNLRGINDFELNNQYSVSIRLNAKRKPKDVQWAYKGHILELEVPISLFKLDEDLFVQVSTKLMKLTVDKTGWNGLAFEVRKFQEEKSIAKKSSMLNAKCSIIKALGNR